MANRNITENDRQVDRENLVKAREAKTAKSEQEKNHTSANSANKAENERNHTSAKRNVTEHDRQVDRDNLVKARAAKAEKDRK